MLPFALSLNTDLTGANRTNFATFYGITGVTELTNAAWRKGLMDQIGTWYVANSNNINATIYADESAKFLAMLPFALSLNTDLTGANRTNFATFYGITGVTELTNAAWRKGLMDQIGTWYVANW